MPIANCIVAPGREPGRLDPVALWAKLSGRPAEQMTINLVSGIRQHGSRYAGMATLWLPSAWPAADVSALQEGLAGALAKYLKASPAEIHVITQLVEPGRVVENGREVRW